MTSHVYTFNRHDLANLLLPPLAAVAVMTLVVRTAAWTGLLPRPRPMADVDQTIVVQRIDASRSLHDASVLLLGDSSCMMNVDAVQLSGTIQKRALNLGLLSYLELDASTRLLEEFNRANPGVLDTVVLLMHPEALKRPGGEDYQTALFHNILAGRDTPWSGSGFDRARSVLGLHVVQGRILDRLIPRVLPGAFGTTYGFNWNLESHLIAHQGSAWDPTRSAPSGNAEYRLHPNLEGASARFKAAVPDGVRLRVGITPVPEGFAAPGYEGLRRRMLAQWGEWLQADELLLDLPFELPANRFATTTHLTREGIKEYTARLAAALTRP